MSGGYTPGLQIHTLSSLVIASATTAATAHLGPVPASKKWLIVHFQISLSASNDASGVAGIYVNGKAAVITNVPQTGSAVDAIANRDSVTLAQGDSIIATAGQNVDLTTTTGSAAGVIHYMEVPA